MRIGIDVGGTKIEIVALEDDGSERLRKRIPTPHAGYDATIRAIVGLVQQTESDLAERGSVGIGIPGTISPKTGLVKNANSTQLIGHPLDNDLAAALGRAVRVANDANCFTLSEATDGAGAGHDVVFGVILGTGVGGGVSIAGKILNGAHAIAGEWGHNPLPSLGREEIAAARKCYCGRANCIESWCSGPAIAADYALQTGHVLSSEEIEAAAKGGDVQAAAVMQRFYDRLARGLATVVNILDPDAIVLGGGLSKIDALYTELPTRVEAYAFTPESPPRIVKNRHGDSSGVRGAAWLWGKDEVAKGLHL